MSRSSKCIVDSVEGAFVSEFTIAVASMLKVHVNYTMSRCRAVRCLSKTRQRTIATLAEDNTIQAVATLLSNRLVILMIDVL